MTPSGLWGSHPSDNKALTQGANQVESLWSIVRRSSCPHVSANRVGRRISPRSLAGHERFPVGLGERRECKTVDVIDYRRSLHLVVDF